MYTYNFQTRELSTIFDNVSHFISSNPMSKISAHKEDYEIIDYKNCVSLALRAEAIENFQILKMWDSGCSTAGKCRVNGKFFHFSLQCDGQYIFLSNVL